jgi:spoIIIJ-associated protein
MIKSIEAVGKTEEEAISSALSQIGKERDEVSVEILERSRSGFLGIGSSPAKVRVSYEYTESVVELTERFLKGLLEKMGSDATPKVEMTGSDRINVELTGDKLGMLIGRRGETLDAIQHITNSVINRGGDSRVHISIDAESYRSKREDSLQRLAEKVAGKVLKYRKNMTLEPMNSYERHVIHTALQDYEGVTTFSTGVEPNRRIVIAYGKNRRGFEDKPSKKT